MADLSREAPRQSLRPPRRIAFVWAQFSAYHVDRIEAAAERLAGRCDLVAVEVASTSTTYAWEPSGTIAGVAKRQLFADAKYERIPWWRRMIAQLRALRDCDTVLSGIAYSELDWMILAPLLRLLGKQVVLMTASKFDDFPRRALRDWLKHFFMVAYSAALVGGCRQFDYVRYLGMRHRPVLPGTNTVSMERVRREAASGQEASPITFGARRFVFVGRFVAKKNLVTLLKAYASYADGCAGNPRELVLIGDGPLRAALEAKCAELAISRWVRFTGFLPAPQVSAELARGLALVLVSREEQWGLVVNEALAVALPVIASYEIGARETLVHNLINGFVVDSGSVAAIAAAMARIDCDEKRWSAFSRASADLAWMADSARFADAVESLFWPDAEPARSDHARFSAIALAESASNLPTGA